MAHNLTCRIETWLGLNENPVGDLALKPGEGVKQINFRVTDEGYLAIRPGFSRRCAANAPVRGLWRGVIKGRERTLLSAGGQLKELAADGSLTDLGALHDGKPCFIPFGGSLYILDGADYRCFDGDGLRAVEGYIPLIATASPPSGGGAAHEEINLLTPKKRQLFSADGTAKTYKLPEKDIAGVEWVKLNGVNATGFTVDKPNGAISFSTAPAVGVDNVEICWNKPTNDRQAVLNGRIFEIYGGRNDTRVFLADGITHRVLYTGLAAGQPSAEYFPALSYIDAGTANTAVKALLRHYDKLLILKRGAAYTTGYDSYMDDEGSLIAAYTCLPLNAAVGCDENGLAALIDNDPVSLSACALFRWRTTATRDERNAQLISGRAGQTLRAMAAGERLLCDVDGKRELALAQGNALLIYHYGRDAFYTYALPEGADITALLNDGGALTVGLKDGRVLTQSDTARSDDGEEIDALFESGALDFGAPHIKKSVRRAYLLLRPVAGGRLTIRLRASRGEDWENIAAAGLSSFARCDFNHFSFGTNRRARTFRLHVKPRNFTHLKLVFCSRSDMAAGTVLESVLELLPSAPER